MQKWPQFYANYGLQWPLKNDPYRGQGDFLEKTTGPLRPVELAVLPTGYGKTICQMMYAALMIRTGKVQHVVVLVPKDNLRSSMTEDWDKTFKSLVPEAVVVNAEKTVYALKRYADTSKHLVVVASYQQINDALSSFCQYYTCAVIADEAHHLYDEGVWARATASLRSQHKIYFTATPIRGDFRPLRDVPVNQAGYADPLIEVSIKQAQREGALCKVRAIAVQFWLDVETSDGVYRVTTDTLEQERTDFTVYEARRQLRYAEGFTTPMIEKMILIHNQKHATAPYKHQILVTAMSAHHADALCKQINAIAGDNDFAHSVHIHKPSAEVDALLCRFRGVKLGANGEEIAISDEERFPCLVQIDMAGEGYNNPYISTLAKADLTKGSSKVTQIIGRGLRVNYSLDTFPQTLDVLLPDDDDATMKLIEADFLVEPGPIREPQEKRGPREIVILDIPDVMVLEAGFIKLYELSGDSVSVQDADVLAWADNHLPGWRNFTDFQKIRAAYLSAGGHRTVSAPKPSHISESAAREKWRAACDQAVGTLAGNVIRLMSNKPLQYNANGLAGKVKAEIHTQWRRLGGAAAKESTANDFEKKHEWVKSINDRVRNHDVPPWLQEAFNGYN